MLLSWCRLCLGTQRQAALYNRAMRAPLCILWLTLWGLTAVVQASTTVAPPSANTGEALVQTPATLPGDQLIEHIEVQDKGVRIDELREGGQTKRVQVKPQNGAPAYDVPPQNSDQQALQSGTQPSGTGLGPRVWTFLNF